MIAPTRIAAVPALPLTNEAHNGAKLKVSHPAATSPEAGTGKRNKQNAVFAEAFSRHGNHQESRSQTVKSLGPISEALRAALAEKHQQILGMTGPVHNKLFPQLGLPDDIVCRMEHIDGAGFLMRPIDGSTPKIPSGEVVFAVLADNPHSVLCFEKNAVFARKDLRDMASGPVNFGHSSLAVEENIVAVLTDKSIPIADKPALCAKPALLAGTMQFPEDDNPVTGGGEMLSWTNDSGHFKPTADDATNNRLGLTKTVLPLDKFVPFSIDD